MVNNIDLLPHNYSCKTKLHKLTDMLIQNISGINSIVLFGSYARFEQKAGSDIDILVLTEKEVCRELRGEWCSIFDELQADLIFYSIKDFQNFNSLLARQIKRDGVLLWKC